MARANTKHAGRLQGAARAGVGASGGGATRPTYSEEDPRNLRGRAKHTGENREAIDKPAGREEVDPLKVRGRAPIPGAPRETASAAPSKAPKAPKAAKTE